MATLLLLLCSWLDACCPEAETRDNNNKSSTTHAGVVKNLVSEVVGMYKNQLQELAQRSCFNLPSYACIREGPDHAPRFKASVNFNGEIFESPSYCTTLRQAEHSAAEVALGTLSTRGPSRSLTARVLDETGVYKNLLQETAHRAGLNLPVYTTVRSGPGHVPVFTCIVELAGMNFSGEPAKTKKQAEKNAAMAAWSALKQMPNSSQTNKTTESNEEQEQVVVARVLSQFKPKEENRPVRQQRDLNQARRRVLSAYRDTNFVATQNSLLQYQQWRSMGLLADSSSSVVYPNQHQNQKQDHFLAQLSPPTVLKPTSSRDKDSPFLYSPNRSIPIQIRSKTQVQEIPTPLEEHQKDEEEWLNGKPSIEKEPNKANSGSVLKPTPTYQSPFPLHKTPMFHHSNQPTTQIKTPISFPRFLNTGSGFHGHGVAPAVHIRSVIPVCATPPARPSTSSNISKPSLVKEGSPPSSVSENHVSTHTEQEEVATEASSKLNKLQL